MGVTIIHTFVGGPAFDYKAGLALSASVWHTLKLIPLRPAACSKSLQFEGFSAILV